MSDNTNLPVVQVEDNADIQEVLKPYVRLEAGKHSPVNVDLANSFWEETKLKHDAILNMLNRRALKDDIKHSKYLGHYADIDSLINAIPEPTPGDYADVDAGEGSPVVRYIWDATDQKWEAQVGVSTQLTGEQIKEMYEGEDNTNAFTDAEKEKLENLGSYGGTHVSYEDLVASTDTDKVSAGSYAIVDPGAGKDVIMYIWDETDQKWVRNTLDGKAIKELYEAEGNVNTFSDDEKAKLASVSNGATANRDDSLNADKEHTHTVEEILGLGSALAGAASNTDPRFTDAREWTASTINQSEAEAGAATTRRAFTAQRVRQAANSAIVAKSGIANGIASLDGNAKIPLSQLSDSIVGQVEYIGLWNASTNTPTLPVTPVGKGHYYVVSVSGTRFGHNFEVGDWIISNGSSWDKVDNTDAVSSVNGRKGNVSGLAESNDPRFTDSREWTATTISQDEAESGTSTTRRAFTAQRVRQAILAWFNGISGEMGRTILSRTTAAQVRSDIGLHTSATRWPTFAEVTDKPLTNDEITKLKALLATVTVSGAAVTFSDTVNAKDVYIRGE